MREWNLWAAVLLFVAAVAAMVAAVAEDEPAWWAITGLQVGAMLINVVAFARSRRRRS